MKRLGIIAAMPGEVKYLVRGWKKQTIDGLSVWRSVQGNCEWVVTLAGAGQPAAARAVAAAEKAGRIDVLVSIGWVGALRKEFAPGKAYRVDGIVDAQTGERFRTSDAPFLERNWLVTSSTVAGAEEKLRLRESYAAGMVDMEAAAVARLSAMRSLPFYAIKAVSDGADDRLPDFNRFIDAQGNFQLIRFILFVLVRPWHWPALIRMGENSKRASRSLADRLRASFDEKGNPRAVPE